MPSVKTSALKLSTSATKKRMNKTTDKSKKDEDDDYDDKDFTVPSKGSKYSAYMKKQNSTVRNWCDSVLECFHCLCQENEIKVDLTYKMYLKCDPKYRKNRRKLLCASIDHFMKTSDISLRRTIVLQKSNETERYFYCTN
ncbi:unnamed protein product [Gordionus sp. m RMFG-2023]